MEQMYMIEIFIDKVVVFTHADSEESTDDKNLIIKLKFGPTIEFIVRESQMVVNDVERKDIIETTETGRKQWSRTIRVGKSYLFPSYPDTVLTLLSKFPLEVEVWNDDEKELPNKIYVGVGTMYWHTKFFHYLKETADVTKKHDPITLKEVLTLYHECCCNQAGEVIFILRMSALGAAITTDFQQMLKDPDKFCFRTDKTPSTFECKRIEGDDPNFCMAGTLYETATLEDPTALDSAQTKIEVCTELQSCAAAAADKYPCQHSGEAKTPEKKYPINKIRMGDIKGPCGNANCALAHKVRTYIRTLETYKAKAGNITDNKGESTKKICGTCSCKDDRWHREDCLQNNMKDTYDMTDKAKCSGCGGFTEPGDTCDDKTNKHFGTGATPKSSKTQIQYVTKVPNYNDAVFRKDYIVEDCFKATYGRQDGTNGEDTRNRIQDSQNNNVCGVCHSRAYTCDVTGQSSIGKDSSPNIGNINNPWIYNAEIPRNSRTQQVSVYNVNLESKDEKDCSCNPVKPSPPCKTFDCNCITETTNIASRKAHKPYCSLYKHKSNCPVTMMKNEEEENKKEDDEDESEPLPYGLPPIQLGPCPVLGRPCSVPDGFARMYKNAALPVEPHSYSDAGKVCCSKEYERIKRAVKEYMKYQKDHDLRCVNKFNVDTERRCCDKEQVLMSLMGRECCGLHKLTIQEKNKKEEQK